MKYLDKNSFRKAITWHWYPELYVEGQHDRSLLYQTVENGGTCHDVSKCSFAPGSRCFWHIHRATKGG